MTEQGMRVLDLARQRAGLSVVDIWLAYVAMGGDAAIHTVGPLVTGKQPADHHEHDLLAQVINERLVELGLDARVPYFDELEGNPSTDTATQTLDMSETLHQRYARLVTNYEDMRDRTDAVLRESQRVVAGVHAALLATRVLIGTSGPLRALPADDEQLVAVRAALEQLAA